MASGLPPPPVNDKPGSFTWMEWYRQLRNYVSTSGSVPWYIINFSGSNITDIASRSHENLQGLQGGTAGEHNHLTNAQLASLGVGAHNNLTSIQGGTTGQYYHITQNQSQAISNTLDLVNSTSSIVLPTTPTLFQPTMTTSASNGISYSSTTGEVTFAHEGVYTFMMFLNALSSTANNTVYFYSTIDTGSGHTNMHYSGRSQGIYKSTEEQIHFSSTNYLVSGTKIKHYIWAENNTVTLNSVDLPGTTPGTLTIPSIRMIWTGSL